MRSSEEECVLNGALIQFGFLLQIIGKLVQLEMKKKSWLILSILFLLLSHIYLMSYTEEREVQEGKEVKTLLKSINLIYIEQAKWGNKPCGKGFPDFTWTSSHHRDTYGF